MNTLKTYAGKGVLPFDLPPLDSGEKRMWNDYTDDQVEKLILQRDLRDAGISLGSAALLIRTDAELAKYVLNRLRGA